MNPDLPSQLDQILSQVQGPGQYVGGEINAVHKPANSVRLRLALAFPDTYSVGMSHHGLRILYAMANALDGVACERVFAPLPDMEQALRQSGLPLGTLETWTPLAACDVIGFSCQYELGATSLLTMLDLGGVPLKRTARGQGDPLVIAGGSVFNPEPLADFVDAFVIGDGEPVLPHLLDILQAMGGRTCSDRDGLLLRLATELPGVYVPALYTAETNADGFAVVAKSERGPLPVKRAFVRDLNQALMPCRPVVPTHQTVHERVTLEIMRGCPNGCRFCQAGYAYRPVRWREVQTLVEAARATYEATGYDEVGLLSLSTSDYPEFDALVEALDAEFSSQGVSLSLPSLRVDEALRTIPARFRSVRKSGLTMAPEAGSERLRAVINKDVSDQNLLEAARAAFSQGWESIKLYFMIGLPTETEEDVRAIAALANQVAALRRRRRRKPAVSLSVSNFVPKPHTPFQWEAMDTPDVLAGKQALIRERVNHGRVQLKVHDPAVSHLEGVLARGDRRLGPTILRAFELGARLDGWDEHFRPALWQQAFVDTDVDPHAYACASRSIDEPLPWSHIDLGVSAAFLKQELERARQSQRTPACGPQACASCGLGAACGFRSGLPADQEQR